MGQRAHFGGSWSNLLQRDGRSSGYPDDLLLVRLMQSFLHPFHILFAPLCTIFHHYTPLCNFLQYFHTGDTIFICSALTLAFSISSSFFSSSASSSSSSQFTLDVNNQRRNNNCHPPPVPPPCHPPPSVSGHSTSRHLTRDPLGVPWSDVCFI